MSNWATRRRYDPREPLLTRNSTVPFLACFSLLLILTKNALVLAGKTGVASTLCKVLNLMDSIKLLEGAAGREGLTIDFAVTVLSSLCEMVIKNLRFCLRTYLEAVSAVCDSWHWDITHWYSPQYSAPGLLDVTIYPCSPSHHSSHLPAGLKAVEKSFVHLRRKGMD